MHRLLLQYDAAVDATREEAWLKEVTDEFQATLQRVNEYMACNVSLGREDISPASSLQTAISSGNQNGLPGTPAIPPPNRIFSQLRGFASRILTPRRLAPSLKSQHTEPTTSTSSTTTTTPSPSIVTTSGNEQHKYPLGARSKTYVTNANGSSNTTSSSTSTTWTMSHRVQ